MACGGTRILLLKAKLLSFLAMRRLAAISAPKHPDVERNVSVYCSRRSANSRPDVIFLDEDSEAGRDVRLRKI
jgi:hypothetical protein